MHKLDGLEYSHVYPSAECECCLISRVRLEEVSRAIERLQLRHAQMKSLSIKLAKPAWFEGY
eukprot:scaffold430_cov187-Alexandrium_tamarense.AAC.13